jgi:hypothetical protein
LNVRNVHHRIFPVAPEALGPLLDGLAGPDDRLWPHDRWPAMRFDHGLRVGAAGGHGPVRYSVGEHVPGRRVVFPFDPDRGIARGFHGHHRFEISAVEGGAELRHVLEARCTPWVWLRWVTVIRPLHDALIEDALDRAAGAVTGSAVPPRPHSWWVRFLRAAARRGKRPRGPVGRMPP